MSRTETGHWRSCSELTLCPQSVSSPLADFAVAANGRSDGPHRSILRWWPMAAKGRERHPTPRADSNRCCTMHISTLRAESCRSLQVRSGSATVKRTDIQTATDQGVCCVLEDRCQRIGTDPAKVQQADLPPHSADKSATRLGSSYRRAAPLTQLSQVLVSSSHKLKNAIFMLFNEN
jgi:hypothetical protein